MRYIKILLTAMLISVLMANPAWCETVQFPQNDGHIWIAQNGTFMESLPGGTRGEEYQDYLIPIQVQIDNSTIEQVGLTDGVRKDSLGRTYNFKLTYGSLPNGLQLDEVQGRIYGTTNDVGVKTIGLRVSSSEAGVADAFRYLTISVSYSGVSVKVSVPSKAPVWEPNGQYKAEFEIADEDLAAEPDKYFNVIYSRVGDSSYIRKGALTTTYVDEPGRYTVTVTGTAALNALLLKPVTNAAELKVAAGNSHSIAFEKSAYEVMVGQELPTISVLTTPDNLVYTMKFEGVDGTVYGPSTVPPTNDMVGKYRVTATTTDSNYTKISATAMLKISKKKVNFAVTGNAEVVYDGDVHALMVTPDDETAQYEVYYTKDGSTDELAAVTEIGTYTLKIRLTANTDVMEIGEISGTQTLTVWPQPSLVLNGGNSPAALGATVNDDGSYTYRGVVYPAAMWGDGTNADADAEAYFVRLAGTSDYDFSRGCVVTDCYGETVDKSQVSVTVDGVSATAWQATVGVHTVAYAAEVNGVQLKAERTLVVLPDLAVGDVNGDGHMNVGDARYLQSNVLTDLSAQDSVYLYRVCDVNHDGKVDADDAKAILNRKNVALVSYYGYLDDEE